MAGNDAKGKAMTTREYENTLNVWLAEALARRRLAAKPEVMRGGGRIDVEVRVGPAIIAVEAEHGQSSAKQREAATDADKQLRRGLAHCAVAVCYPDDADKAAVEGGNYIWQVRGGDSPEYSGGSAAWQSGGIDQLAQVIRLAPAQLGDPDAVAASLSASLDLTTHS